MKKYEVNRETGQFCIDPKHLAEGLKAAAAGKHIAISIEHMDLRTKNLHVDVELLTSYAAMRKLFLHRDLRITPIDFARLEVLDGLTELSVKEYGPLGYRAFPRLESLVLTAGTGLPGLDRLPALRLVYLGRWNATALPMELSGVPATALRISASKKLAGIEPAWRAPRLESLMLQGLPAISVGPDIHRLASLRELHVEKCGWSNFEKLRLPGLRKLFASKLESLRFIRNLEGLEDLFFWECVEGDLRPVLDHPTLKSIRFFPAKKHYSHKLPELQKALAAKSAGLP